MADETKPEGNSGAKPTEHAGRYYQIADIKLRIVETPKELRDWLHREKQKGLQLSEPLKLMWQRVAMHLGYIHHELYAKLLERVDKLEARVAELEDRKGK